MRKERECILYRTHWRMENILSMLIQVGINLKLIARFSPDDVNMKYRYELKKRFDLLPTQ